MNMTAFLYSSVAVLFYVGIQFTNIDKLSGARKSENVVPLVFGGMGAMVTALVVAMFPVLEPSLALAIVICFIGLLFFQDHCIYYLSCHGNTALEIRVTFSLVL
ncbi:hypothetical protein PanWU01x14_210130 [Parasponia andersonii]|uniref:Uncharacterized protein n=1 Tax=Parasponia andersonii TaxID=3476 RepID=A0A2P5BU42_PARAD|nr:hypothetical protein PanWU01x14_210130 [Parasponia andersonii]